MEQMCILFPIFHELLSPLKDSFYKQDGRPELSKILLCP
jgi:hypothetical protein